MKIWKANGLQTIFMDNIEHTTTTLERPRWRWQRNNDKILDCRFFSCWIFIIIIRMNDEMASIVVFVIAAISSNINVCWMIITYEEEEEKNGRKRISHDTAMQPTNGNKREKRVLFVQNNKTIGKLEDEKQKCTEFFCLSFHVFISLLLAKCTFANCHEERRRERERTKIQCNYNLVISISDKEFQFIYDFSFHISFSISMCNCMPGAQFSVPFFTFFATDLRWLLQLLMLHWSNNGFI